MEKTLIGELDLHLFNEGTHTRLYRCLGAHPSDGGVVFGVWAPNAQNVRVVGDFNDWRPDGTSLNPVGGSGLWEAFVEDVPLGSRYKYRIQSRVGDYIVDKADPLARNNEIPPSTASLVHEGTYRWNDQDWMNARSATSPMRRPMSIYECHTGSWRRVPEDQNRSLNYRELAEWLVRHLQDTGFTHVELLPVMEHPFFASWGYQTTGYFCPSSRYGSPEDLKYLIDVLHQNGLGVILDWVPSHFPTDEHGLVYFDGTHVYEHADPRQGYHPDWKSAIFNYGRFEVRSFLMSSACYWLDEFHADGLRVDAVASMLYLDYSRQDGEWIPNEYGGRENLQAMDFLRQLNRTVHAEFPGAVTIAEESTAWPMVSRPIELGGLGFTMKWDMGWMHDTLDYFSHDPIHRKYHHNQLTFRGLYAYNENFVMPLSHDEVVHGKGSLYGKMPGDHWQKLANLRLLYAYMHATPGKKLVFMGGEFGQGREWNHDGSLDWHLLSDPTHSGLMRCVSDLNRLHRLEPALHTLDFDPRGFEWIDCNDWEASTVIMLRKGDGGDQLVVAAFNFTPVPRTDFVIGLPRGGRWAEIFNGDADVYGGSGMGNFGEIEAEEREVHGRPYSAHIVLPPLAGVFFRWEGD
ncbi:MAG: 1,4-alpha-glucan branching protein GlgB [Myxococcota bacterium]